MEALAILLAAVVIIALVIARSLDKEKRKKDKVLKSFDARDTYARNRSYPKKNDALLSSTNRVVKNRNYPISSDNANTDSFKIAEDGTIIRIGATQICPQCQRTFANEMKFCGVCGNRLVKTAS